MMRRAVVAMAVGLAIVTVLPSAAAASGASTSSPWGRFAFAPVNGSVLAVFDASTRSLTAAASARGPSDFISAPAWSNDGRHIAYSYVRCTAGCVSSTGELHTVGPTGAHDRVVLRVPYGYIGSPTWSPDNARLAFSVTFPTSPATFVWTSRSDGSDVHQLAIGSMPSWSPDGSTIAFVDGATSALALADPVTGRVHLAMPLGEVLSQPVWSRQGLIAAQVMLRRDQAASVVTYDSGHIWVFDPHDGSRYRVDDGSVYGPPSWSPDGQALTYMNADGVWVARLPRGDRRRVAIETPPGPTFETVSAPSWSPSGHWIVFGTASFSTVYSADAWRWTIDAVAPDGSGRTTLVRGTGTGEIGDPVSWART